MTILSTKNLTKTFEGYSMFSLPVKTGELVLDQASLESIFDKQFSFEKTQKIVAHRLPQVVL